MPVLKANAATHENLNVVLFRAFDLSRFRDCLLEFFARKNTNSRTKRLNFELAHTSCQSLFGNSSSLVEKAALTPV